MSRRRIKELFPLQDLDLNMSPMIDMVFLLLIFFMAGSTMITFHRDKRVVVPVAQDAKVPELVAARTIINVYADGTIRDERGRRQLTVDEVRGILAAAKASDPGTRLRLRADRRVPHEYVKRVITASAEAGVNEVIIGTFVSDK